MTPLNWAMRRFSFALPLAVWTTSGLLKNCAVSSAVAVLGGSSDNKVSKVSMILSVAPSKELKGANLVVHSRVSQQIEWIVVASLRKTFIVKSSINFKQKIKQGQIRQVL